MAIILTDGKVDNYIDRIEALGGAVTEEVKEKVAVKTAETVEEQAM